MKVRRRLRKTLLAHQVITLMLAGLLLWQVFYIRRQDRVISKLVNAVYWMQLALGIPDESGSEARPAASPDVRTF